MERIPDRYCILSFPFQKIHITRFLFQKSFFQFFDKRIIKIFFVGKNSKQILHSIISFSKDTYNKIFISKIIFPIFCQKNKRIIKIFFVEKNSRQILHLIKFGILSFSFQKIHITKFLFKKSFFQFFDRTKGLKIFIGKNSKQILHLMVIKFGILLFYFLFRRYIDFYFKNHSFNFLSKEWNKRIIEIFLEDQNFLLNIYLFKYIFEIKINITKKIYIYICIYNQ